ncbi:MAG: hypothetical protein U9R15_12080 [Chloroflexota bacterium]|nr:hypothetical protein [Chloroflexota bacterium]
MALSTSGLKDKILDVLNPSAEIDKVTQEYIEGRVEKLAEAIIDYMKANTVVQTTVTTTGTAAAQTGTGIGSIS